MLFALGDLARAGKVRGAVYTQLTDVEDEVNGLVSYDRAALKLRAAALGAPSRARAYGAAPLARARPPPRRG